MKKDTPPVDELAICIPQDRNYAFYTMPQMLVYENVRRLTTEYINLANPPLDTHQQEV